MYTVYIWSIYIQVIGYQAFISIKKKLWNIYYVALGHRQEERTGTSGYNTKITRRNNNSVIMKSKRRRDVVLTS